MDIPEETEVNENEFGPPSLGKSTIPKFSDKSDKRKGFIGYRRRGNVLAELETISENNSISEYSFSSRGNLSLNLHAPPKRSSDRLSQSFAYHSVHQLDKSEVSGDSFLQPPNPDSHQELQTTPPSVLRQRIKDVNEVKYYLEKELNELKEFTTAEKQILAVEKGYDALKEETSHLKLELDNLQEQNSSLKMELEEMGKLTNSQKELITDLKDNFEEVRLELKTLESQKSEVIKELAEVKKKLVDEECKSEISEMKWKKREEELMRSLEESWMQLKVKEDRLVKMQENIQFLYSERDTIAAGNDCYSLENMEKIKSLSTKVEELFNLSCSNIEHENNQKTAFKFLKCNCKGDSADNSNRFGSEIINSDLKKCYETLEEMENKLKEKESIIEHFTNSLNNLENTFEFHVYNISEDVSEKTLCNIAHTSVIDKISCEIMIFKEKLLKSQRQIKCKSLSNIEGENIANNEVVSSTKEIDSLITYKERIKTLEIEIENLKQQADIKESERKSINNEIISDNCKSFYQQADVYTQTQNSFVSAEEYEDKITNFEAVLSENAKSLPEQAEVSCQTQLNFMFVEEYEDKIKSLEDLISTNSKSSTVNAEVSSQTLLNYVSVQEYEDKIRSLQDVLSENCKPLTEHNEVSAQTDANSVSVHEYEDKIRSLEAVISENSKSSTVNAEVSSQTQLNYVSVQEYEDKIRSLEAVASDNSKPPTENVEASSQTLLNFISFEEHEEKIRTLEVLIYENSKSSAVNAEVSSQTKLNYNSVQEYENKIKSLEAVISENRNRSIEQAEISSQTQLNLMTVQEYEEKIRSLETVILENRKPLTEIAEVSSQTQLNFISVQEYEDKICFLESAISENSKSSIEQTENSSQTQFSFVSAQEYEDKISSLESHISGSSKNSIEVSSQTQLTLLSVQEYEEKINNLKAEIAAFKKASVVKVDCPSTMQHQVYEKDNESSEIVIDMDYEQKDNETMNSTERVEICSNQVTDTTFSNSPEVINDSFNTSGSDENRALSDSVAQKVSSKNVLHSESKINIIDEFIELPAPDISTLDLTFNYQLEHSIFKSKLHNADLSSSESYDPLASISEVSNLSKIKDPFQSSSEKELKILQDDLNSNVEQNIIALSLITELENSLLVPEESNKENHMITRLERIVNLIRETVGFINDEGIKNVGLLQFFKTLHNDNIAVNKRNEILNFHLKGLQDSLGHIKALKLDLLALERNVHSLRDIDSNFSDVSNKLMNLYEDIGIYNNESKDNFKNLLNENKNLKEELLNLKLINNDLKSTSQLYTDLLAQHSKLKILLDEKEHCVRESAKLRSILSNLLKKIKHSTIKIPYFEFMDSEVNESALCFESCTQFLSKVEEIIEDCQNSYILLFSFCEFEGMGIFKCIESLCADKNSLQESCTSLKSEMALIKNKLSSLVNASNVLKSNIKIFSSDVVDMKESLNKQLRFVNHEMDHFLQKHVEHINEENQNLKSKVSDLESLLSVNEKYSELLNSYKELESDIRKRKLDCSEHLNTIESLKNSISLFEDENCKLKDQMSLTELENVDLKSKLKDLECLVSVNEKYCELLKSYENLETELAQKQSEYNEFILIHDSLKSKASEMESENHKLKELNCKYECESKEYSEKIKRLEHVQLEQAELRIKLSNLESLHDKYSALVKMSEELEKELHEKKEMCSKLEQVVTSLKENLSDLETKNLELKEKYEVEIEGNLSKNLEELKSENENLKCQLYSLNSLRTANNEEYSELMLKHKNIEAELSQCRQSYSELSKLHDSLMAKHTELEQENNIIKESISKYENDVKEYKDMCSSLELTLIEKEEEITRNHEQLQNLNSLKESHATLKEDNERYIKMVDNIRIIMKFVTSSAEDNEISIDDKNDFPDIFTPLKSLFSELVDLRKKLQYVESSITLVSEEKLELIKKLESLNNEIELNQQKMELKEAELSELLKKEQEISKNLKVEIEKYENEIKNILSSMKFTGELAVNDESWNFIKNKIAPFKSSLDPRSCNNSDDKVFDLEKRVEFLESQLLDTDSFKRKFSQELHGLKPELCVSDLMKLSLEDLQFTMISTIMEKENAIVANLEKDYEMKLALSSERIHQLEEEEKRRMDWIQRIESENDRLTNECKQIQESNELLKNDILAKVEKIKVLQKEIEKNKINAAESFLQEQEKEKLEQEKERLAQEELENEKSFYESNIQEAVLSLTKKLEEKNKECDEALLKLQSKSETIFQLEKAVFDLKAEKTLLKEEVNNLKEELNSKLHSFEEIKKSLEQDISLYKEELQKVNDAIIFKEEHHIKEKLDLEKEIESKVFLVEQLQKLENKADLVINKNIGNMLDGHMKKVDKLNMKIKELSVQLFDQNIKDSKLKDQDSYIESLKSEIIVLKSAIALLEKEKFEALSAQNEFNCKASVNELVHEATKALKSELIEKNKELSFVQEERNAFFQDSLECHQLKEKMSTLNKVLEECQDELRICKDKLTFFQDENITLKEQSVKYEQLNSEFSLLKDNLKQCQDELIALKNEKEDHSKLPLALKSEMAQLESQLQSEVARLEREKSELKKELLENLEFEKGLRNSLKIELAKKENELLNLKKEKDLFVQEYNKNKQSWKLEVNNLIDNVKETSELNNELQSELLSLKKNLDEQTNYSKKLQSELEKIHSYFHSEESCPYKKDSSDSRIKIDEYNKLLVQEQEKFKLWKTNFEEDLRCKVLLIGDLESKLKSETLRYKEALMSVSVLQHKTLELEEKLKKSEEKLLKQREIFIREKSKLETELKNKEKYELKLTELRKKSEELAKSITIFLEKVGGILKKDISDLGTAFHELQCMHIELLEEKQKFKDLDDECEGLNKIISDLQNELEKLYAKETAEKEHMNMEMSKLKEEQKRNEKLTHQIFDLQSQINSLEGNLKKMGGELLEKNNEIKSFEININNLLEDKQKLQCLYSELEKKISDLQMANDHLQKKDNMKIEELMKELNYLKLQIVNKNTKISKLEMRLESDCLPFQRRAETAEKKVEELSKELKSTKIALSSRESTIFPSSPRLSVKVDSGPVKLENGQSQLIATLQEEIKKLQKEKRSLKQLAALRNNEIKDLQEKLERRQVPMASSVT